MKAAANFVDDATLARLDGMSREAINALDFGAVRLTDEGVVALYSERESQLAGVAVEHAEGRNFFTQVAPCCNNRLVYGRFKKGVVEGAMDITLPYTFTYRMRPTNVFLRLWRHGPNSNWILIKRR